MYKWFLFAIWRALESTIWKDGEKGEFTLYIVDGNHQRSVILVDHSRNFKGVWSMMVAMGKYLSRQRKLMFKNEKKGKQKTENLSKITAYIN